MGKTFIVGVLAVDVPELFHRENRLYIGKNLILVEIQQADNTLWDSLKFPIASILTPKSELMLK